MAFEPLVLGVCRDEAVSVSIPLRKSSPRREARCGGASRFGFAGAGVGVGVARALARGGVGRAAGGGGAGVGVG